MSEFDSKKILGFSVPLKEGNLITITPNEGPINETNLSAVIKNMFGDFSQVKTVKFGDTIAVIDNKSTKTDLIVKVPMSKKKGLVKVNLLNSNNKIIQTTTFTYLEPIVTPNVCLINTKNTSVIIGNVLVNDILKAKVFFNDIQAVIDVKNSTINNLMVTVPLSKLEKKVTVKLINGNKQSIIIGTFSYVNSILKIPTITSINPSKYLINSTSIATITGKNLLTIQKIKFGNNFAFFNKTMSNDNSIVLIIPNSDKPGVVNVNVYTNFGIATIPFTYITTNQLKPTISSITPSTGSSEGRYNAIIRGTNLNFNPDIKFGNSETSRPQSNADGTNLTVSVPSKGTDINGNPDPNEVDVVILTTYGSATTKFTYT